MRHLNKFNESIERDIRQGLDGILVWLEDKNVNYTLTDNSNHHMIGRYFPSLKRVIITLKGTDDKLLSKHLIEDEIDTVIDFMKLKWGDITIKYNYGNDRGYHNMLDEIPYRFEVLYIVIEKWRDKE